MIVIVNGLLGILTGGAMIALATNTLEPDTGGILLMLLGLGLVGLGLLGRKKIPIGGRYLALGMTEVNLRGASLFLRPGGKEDEHVRRCSEREVEGNQRGGQSEVGQTHR